MIKTEGLILREQSVGENDKLVTVLTRSNGVIRCFARRAKKLISNVSSACQVMTYSRLEILERRDKYIITSAEVIKSFFEIFSDINSLALGYYFCELSIRMIPENMPSEEHLQLLLNCLYAVSGKLKPFDMIKSVFELRIMMLDGIVPDILFCSECGAYDSEDGTMYFNPIANKLLCPKCCYKQGNINQCMTVSMGCITAVRYCITAHPKKILSFQLSELSLLDLSKFTERFLLAHIDCYCPTLEFYKSVKNL